MYHVVYTDPSTKEVEVVDKSISFSIARTLIIQQTILHKKDPNRSKDVNYKIDPPEPYKINYRGVKD